MKACKWINVLLMVVVSVAFSLPVAAEKLPIESIQLPPGFKIDIFAQGVDNARSMVRSPGGTIFVGTRKAGNVYAIVDKDNNFKADGVITIASGLNMPNGVDFRNGSLYVAEVNRVLRFDDIENRLKNPPLPVIVNDTFPDKRHHGWKYMRFGPDGWLYVPVGAPCNICESKDPRFAGIMRMKPDGTKLEIFASGVRNTVGFDWHPDTKELWFTDNGRDWLGDDMPPDELNRAHRKGLHFGYPYWHGRRIPDPKFGKGRKAGEFTLPVQELGAHVAALGVRFYTGKMFPNKYQKVIFIAEHGSWNRSSPIGYRITTVFLKDNNAVKYEVFAKGWINGKWGRPVDIIIMPDGSLMISDDKGDAIYRIRYHKEK
jgi:glucose/arabinose dehydrogenase